MSSTYKIGRSESIPMPSLDSQSTDTRAPGLTGRTTEINLLVFKDALAYHHLHMYKQIRMRHFFRIEEVSRYIPELYGFVVLLQSSASLDKVEISSTYCIPGYSAID